ncbi:MAG: hypothetical protein EOO27_11540 [Comamonadaceae bacterium]|nr:MAG: hypothetical protein EOO27_11540 [Comamonadaceae bacterium]
MTNLPSGLVSTRRPQARTVSSDDGSVSFTLARMPGGVLVERVQFRGGTARVVQTALFTDDESFRRWCDADTLRFDYPLLHVSLRHDGNDLFTRSA